MGLNLLIVLHAPVCTDHCMQLLDKHGLTSAVHMGCQHHIMTPGFIKRPHHTESTTLRATAANMT